MGSHSAGLCRANRRRKAQGLGRAAKLPRQDGTKYEHGVRSIVVRGNGKGWLPPMSECPALVSYKSVNRLQWDFPVMYTPSLGLAASSPRQPEPREPAPASLL
jgi:hypothetical protein